MRVETLRNLPDMDKVQEEVWTQKHARARSLHESGWIFKRWGMKMPSSSSSSSTLFWRERTTQRSIKNYTTHRLHLLLQVFGTDSRKPKYSWALPVGNLSSSSSSSHKRLLRVRNNSKPSTSNKKRKIANKRILMKVHHFPLPFRAILDAKCGSHATLMDPLQYL